MDFKDWRQISGKDKAEQEAARRAASTSSGKRFADRIEDLIREAEARGEFDNLPGTGKPLQIEDLSAAGERALGYHLLQNNNLLPPEIDLMKEINQGQKRAEAKLERIKYRRKALWEGNPLPSRDEMRAFNATVEKAAAEYEQALRALNSKILTLNVSAPAQLHRPLLDVELLVNQFRDACPPFPA